MKRLRRGLIGCAVVVLAIGLGLGSPVASQPAPPAAVAGDAVVADSDDVRAVVAPVALYPDPILALVLQSSTLPLQVVQAGRYLDKRAKDPKLPPDPDWDKSIIGLLNYPRQLQSMAEYIDWTETLGNAVVDELDTVQTSIQDIRLAAYHAGFLKSNARQKVEVKNDVVLITSTDPKTVSIPQYDPAALLTALDDIEEAENAADEAAAAPAPAPAATSKQPATAKQAPPAAATSPAAPPQPADAAAGTATPVAVAAEPVTPPAITYGEPESSFWQSAATFGGGAVIGGLLGWGLTEAFDDDDDDWRNDDDWDNDDVQDALRNRREFRDERRDDILEARADRREETRETREDRAARAREKLNEQPKARSAKSGAAAGGAVKASATAKREVKLPGAGTQAGVSERVKQRNASAQPAKAAGKPAAAKLTSAKQQRSAAGSGFAQKAAGKGIAASAGGARQVRQESDRGARSRIAQASGGQKRVTPASVSRERGGGGGIASGHDRGGAAKADGARGRASREGGHGGGGRGGGGRRNQ